MKSNDYVKYLTRTVIEYLDLPKEERHRKKQEKKQIPQPKLYKWFGIMPYVVKEGVRMLKIKKT